MQMQPATSGRAAGTAAGQPGIRARLPAHQPPPRVRVRVRRARALALLAVVAFLLLMAPGLARGDGPERPVARVTYTVQAGDTLWGIARRAAPERDPREVVDQLLRDNRLRGQLQPGQQLSLPVPSR
ncbi:MAG TPA: LysM peptidoglycan-binding domain-containing protein [Actinomycetes bacterium]|jgi:nucleoid-associated protein YgaU|nr:LysM peptidoglycan-binding domain-containing protein [Actinomycetes bacterium]